MAAKIPVCKRVIMIAEDYLGPTAPRFIDRLCTSHLGKDAAKLTENDMDELIKWARLAAAMLTDDSELVAEFMRRLDSLAKTPT